MNNTAPERLSPRWRWFIIIVSIVIPVAVSLLGVLPKIEVSGEGLRSVINRFPTFNAFINGITFFVLIAAFVAVKKKNIELHKRLITVAMIFSILFLVSYVVYHLTTDHTRYTGGNP
ncbi:MAG: DUF420 domain-containing protein, partial [Flavobacteriales bacterium]|nr:DUF420 domain-containing protein [Flavobacteriales bacterium]